MGAQEYGDDSFKKSMTDLLGEIHEEVLDIVGWGFILDCRIRQVRAKLVEFTDMEGKLNK
jgi:hypothetical protein